MRIFISKTYLKSCKELPKSIMKLEESFLEKFEINSKSSSIHLEKINCVSDDSMRSAKLNDCYRVIVGLSGQDSYTLLYVGKHKEAYEWAKCRKFGWNENVQSFQIANLVEIGTTPPQTIEIEKAKPSLLGRIGEKKLLLIGVPNECVQLVKGIRDLDDLEQMEDRLPEGVFECLFDILDNNNEKVIDDIIKQINNGKAKKGEDKFLSNNNKSCFLEITGDKELARILKEDSEEWQLFLHPSQRCLVERDFSGATKVSGSAGTGKTIAAVHRLKYLAGQSKNTKILFTTYTRSLVENLRELIAKMNIPVKKYELNNIDTVLSDLAKRYNIVPAGFKILYDEYESKNLWSRVLANEITEFDRDFLFEEYRDVIMYNNSDRESYLSKTRVGRNEPLTRSQRIKIWGLKERYENLKRQLNVFDRAELFNKVADFLTEKNIHPYTNVIVDEFQNLSNPELRFIRALVAEGKNDLFIVGDPFQRIYSGRRMRFSAAGINIRGNRSHKLKVNYRTTEEIKRVAVSVVSGQKYDDCNGGEETNKGYVSLLHGERPIYKVFRSIGEELEFVRECINICCAEGIQMKDICIAGKTRPSYENIKADFHNKKDIEYCDIKKGRREGDINGVSFCTFYSLQGLEYSAVILVGVDEENLKPQSSTTTNETRSLLYVAISRARQRVFITGVGKPSKLLDKADKLNLAGKR